MYVNAPVCPSTSSSWCWYNSIAIGASVPQPRTTPVPGSKGRHSVYRQPRVRTEYPMNDSHTYSVR